MISNVVTAEGTNGAIPASCNFVVFRSRMEVTNIYPGHAEYLLAQNGDGLRIKSKATTTWRMRCARMARSASSSEEAAMEGYEKLGYMALNVSDVGRSRDFYEKQVGLQSSGEAEGIAFLRCSEDHHNISLHAGSQPGLKRAGFEMKSTIALDLLGARLASEGIAVVEVPAAERKLLGLGRAFRITEPIPARPTSSTTICGNGAASRSIRRPPRSRARECRAQGAGPQGASRFDTEVLGFRVSDMIDGAICFMRCHPNPYHHGVGLGLRERGDAAPRQLHGDGGRRHRPRHLALQQGQVPIVNGPGRHPPSDSISSIISTPTASRSSTASAWRNSPPRAPASRG